jgi:hypothetical protein
MEKTTAQTQKLTPDAILRRVPTHCSVHSAQAAQSAQRTVQPTQPENQSVLKNCQILSIVLNVWPAPIQKSNKKNSPKQKQLTLTLNAKNL